MSGTVNGPWAAGRTQTVDAPHKLQEVSPPPCVRRWTNECTGEKNKNSSPRLGSDPHLHDIVLRDYVNLFKIYQPDFVTISIKNGNFFVVLLENTEYLCTNY